MPKWIAVTTSEPCPACGHTDWCAWTPDHARLKCERTATPPPGFRLVKVMDGGAMFSPVEELPRGHRRPTGISSVRADLSIATIEWAKEADRLRAALTPTLAEAAAHELGIRSEALACLGAGWASKEDLRHFGAGGDGWHASFPDGALAFPERDGAGVVVGIAFRAAGGKKGFASRGAKRGLIIPSTLAEGSDPVLIVEGPSDVAACVTLGLAAVGRPNNCGGAEHLAELLDGRNVLVVGERDQKANGNWPGRKGAKAVAARLATEWGVAVQWTLPPGSTKDVRAWLNDRVAAGLDVNDAQACRAAGEQLIGDLSRGAKAAKPEKAPAQSELLVRLALETYRIGVAEGDEPFAIKLDGPNVALMFRGSRNALRSALARDFRRQYGITPNASALADALTTLEGEALEREPEPVHLRVARHDGRIILDLGTADGRAVVIGPDGWTVAATSPVVFRRTALTAPLPEPERGGSLQEFRELVNVTEQTWPLLVGWIVSAYFPDIPHAILMTGGDQGTGKSTAMKLSLGLFDPSTAPLRAPPRDLEQWVVAACGSWGVVLDNISTIPEWLADALCRAATGDGLPKRRLWTDSELAVLAFRRVIAITSIDCGVLRGDLGDRVVAVDLETIDSRQRRSDKKLMGMYGERHGRILGAVLDVVAGVLRELPALELDELPRMADFALVLAAMDRAIGTNALDLYLSQSGRIAQDVVEDDAVGPAMVAFASQRHEWTGPAGALYKAITPDKDRPREWPKTPRALSGRLRRLRPALAIMGVVVMPPAKGDKTRQWQVRHSGDGRQLTAPIARQPDDHRSAACTGGSPPGGNGVQPPDRPDDSPTSNGLGDDENGTSGRLGGPGGGPLHLSNTCRLCRGTYTWRLAAEPDGLRTCARCHPPSPGLSVVFEGSPEAENGGVS